MKKFLQVSLAALLLCVGIPAAMVLNQADAQSAAQTFSFTKVRTDTLQSRTAAVMTATSSAPATGSTDTGFLFNVTNTFSTSARTDSLLTIQNAGSDRYRFWNNGTMEVVSPANNTGLGLRFATPSGGAAIFSVAGGVGEILNFVADNATPTTVNLGGVGANSALVVGLGPKVTGGAYELIVSNTAVTASVPLALSKTDGSGTPGAATINKPAFRVAVISGQTSVVVTDSYITAASNVFCSLQTADGALYIKSVVPGSGIVTITMSGATGAADNIGCMVVN